MIDSANFINERNFHVSERERSARKIGKLPNRLDPLDSSRSKKRTADENVHQIHEKTQLAAEVTPPEALKSKVDDAPSGFQREEPRTCIKVADEFQKIAFEASQCFNPTELKKMVGLTDNNMLPVCIAIIMAIISFVLGVYVTKNGYIDTYL
jgi:hypothetical protein